MYIYVYSEYIPGLGVRGLTSMVSLYCKWRKEDVFLYTSHFRITQWSSRSCCSHLSVICLPRMAAVNNSYPLWKCCKIVIKSISLLHSDQSKSWVMVPEAFWMPISISWQSPDIVEVTKEIPIRLKSQNFARRLSGLPHYHQDIIKWMYFREWNWFHHKDFLTSLYSVWVSLFEQSTDFDHIRLSAFS